MFICKKKVTLCIKLYKCIACGTRRCISICVFALVTFLFCCVSIDLFLFCLSTFLSSTSLVFIRGFDMDFFFLLKAHILKYWYEDFFLLLFWIIDIKGFLAVDFKWIITNSQLVTIFKCRLWIVSDLQKLNNVLRKRRER